MRKRPALAIAVTQAFRARRGGGLPPGSHQETLLSRFFTSLSRVTGLTAQARRMLNERLNRLDDKARVTGTHLAQNIEHLTQLQNKVVDGGWGGLWTALRICLGFA